MLSDTLPPSPLYDPKAKVVNFKLSEDMDNIRINLAGKGVLYEDPDFYYYVGDMEERRKGDWQATEWRRPKEICSRPKFIDGKPDRFDALQGKLGDCWVVAAMEVLTFNETLIRHVVPPDQSFDDHYIGAFHFRIWSLGVWYDVVVDDRLPVFKKSKKLFYCSSRSGDVFWAALLEKAYAKFWVTDKVSYEVIETGTFSTSLINFTGGIVEIVCANPKMREEYGYLPSGTTLRSLLHETYKRNALMICMSFGRLAPTFDVGLLTNHGYAVTAIYKCADDDPFYSYKGVGLYLLRLLNPWGETEFKGFWSDEDESSWRQIDKTIRDKLNVKRQDGEFWMCEEDFEKYFVLVFICHLGPGQYIDSRNINLNFAKWKTTCFYGEWVKGITAVGSNRSYRHKLPQYGIELKSPENATNDLEMSEMCFLVVHLTHRAKYRRYDINCPPKKHCKGYNVGVYVYETTNIIKNTNERLGEEFFKKNEPVNQEPNWTAGDGRSYSLEILLSVGRYCIVPCTQWRDEDSQFLLRVFTTSKVDQWEYDTKISKSSPLAEQSLNYTDKCIHTLFRDAAQYKNEIDWSDLRYIFDAAFNPTAHHFRVLTSIVNYTLDVFGMFSTTRYYDENDYFTKDQCRSMIAMLDHNQSGTLNFSEFRELWNKINFWAKVYEQHRDETVGHLQVNQLKEALGAIGYDINTRTVHSLSYVFANDEGKILWTDFVLCGVALETALSRLEKESLESGNKLTLTLEEWVKSTLVL